jgi:hypothetical protein
MRNQSLFAAVVTVLLVRAPEALAEEPGDKGQDAAASAVAELLVVPEIPAAAALGLDPSGFARPETLEEFVVQALSGIDMNDGGAFRPGVAAEIGLGHLGYRKWTLRDWRALGPGARWGHAFLDSTRLSFATTYGQVEQPSGAKLGQAAVGVRWTLLNDRDYRFWSEARLREVDAPGNCTPPETSPLEKPWDKTECERFLKEAYREGAMLDLGWVVVVQKATEWEVPSIPLYLAFNYQKGTFTYGAGVQANLRHLQSAPDLRVGGRVDAEWQAIVSGRASLSAAVHVAEWSGDKTSLLAGLSLSLAYRDFSILLGTSLDTNFDDFAADAKKMPLTVSIGYGKMAVPFSL